MSKECFEQVDTLMCDLNNVNINSDVESNHFKNLKIGTYIS